MALLGFRTNVYQIFAAINKIDQISQKSCINAINSKALEEILTMLQKLCALKSGYDLEAPSWQRVI